MLVEMANAYCDSLNDGSIPTIESAWDYVRQEEVVKGVKMAIDSEEVRSHIDKILAQESPLTDEQLETEKHHLTQLALHVFESSGCAMLNEDDIHK